MLKRFLVRVLHFSHFVCGTGTWSLRPHERQVVEAVIQTLPAGVQSSVRAQLAQDFFVERIPQGRINVLRYYESDSSLEIGGSDFSDRLFKVRIEVDGSSQVAHVTFYEGWLFSIEFKKPGRFFSGKQISVRNVTDGKPRESYTRVIDRAEHGAAGARGEPDDD